jgi:probable HAF family extracellular repeat protein
MTRNIASNLVTLHRGMRTGFGAAALLLAGMAGSAIGQVRMPPTFTTTFTLVDLSSNAPQGFWSVAYAINNSGRVTGEFYNAQHWNRAFETQPNAIIRNTDDLGTLTINGAADSLSGAVAINGSGEVVGVSGMYVGYSLLPNFTPNVGHAFRLIPGNGLENLNTTSSSGSYVLSNATGLFARGINDNGWIVGSYQTPSDTNGYQAHSFVSFGPGWTQPIDSWYGNPAFSATYDVNNRTQVVGYLRSHAADPPTAFFFDVGTMHLTTIGLPPGAVASFGNAVNDSGQVVVNAWFGNPFGQPRGFNDTTHAFLFQDLNHNGVADSGELVDLDPADHMSAALSINNSGVAVGYNGALGTYEGSSRAAMFSNGRVTDLNTLVNGGTGGAILRVAYGINDGGQIVGFMDMPNGDIHAFRLDPVLRRLFL